jgi:hypothetical protein
MEIFRIKKHYENLCKIRVGIDMRKCHLCTAPDVSDVVKEIRSNDPVKQRINRRMHLKYFISYIMHSIYTKCLQNR